MQLFHRFSQMVSSYIRTQKMRMSWNESLWPPRSRLERLPKKCIPPLCFSVIRRRRDYICMMRLQKKSSTFVVPSTSKPIEGQTPQIANSILQIYYEMH